VTAAPRAVHEEDGLTVICNRHALDTARRCRDRVIGMRKGGVVFDGPAEGLTEAAAREIHGARDGLLGGRDLHRPRRPHPLGAPRPRGLRSGLTPRHPHRIPERSPNHEDARHRGVAAAPVLACAEAAPSRQSSR